MELEILIENFEELLIQPLQTSTTLRLKPCTLETLNLLVSWRIIPI